MLKLHYDFPGGKVLIVGGWYGLMAYLIRQQFPQSSMGITTLDMDPKCEQLGYKMFYDQNIEFITQDATDPEFDYSEYSVIICTSCEHIDKAALEKIIKSKDPQAWVVFQSNNFVDHPSHINCSSDIDAFVDSIRPHLYAKWIAYKGTLHLSFHRYMVIGK
jgi:hypothetical protein